MEIQRYVNMSHRRDHQLSEATWSSLSGAQLESLLYQHRRVTQRQDYKQSIQTGYHPATIRLGFDAST